MARHRQRKTAFWLSFACAGSTLLFAPATAAAASLLGAASIGDRGLRAIIPVIVLLAAAVTLAVFELRRRRRLTREQEQTTAHPQRSAFGAIEPVSDDLVAAASAMPDPHAPTMSTGELELVGSEPTTVAPGILDSLVDGESDGGLFHHPARVDDSLDRGTAVMACSECERAFEMGTRHCPYDGRLLAMREQDLAAREDEVECMVCPECDTEHEPEAVYCPHDDARLVARTEGDAPDELSAAPMRVCVVCAQELPATASACTHCHDGGQLRFMFGRQTAGIFVDNGPHTRICGSCGKRYGEALSFCRDDGTELVRLN